MQTADLDLSADVIDVRDIIARVEELQTELETETGKDAGDYGSMDAFIDAAGDSDAATEYRALAAILEDLKGYGGDEDWRGDWYPVTLVRDSYFTDYTRELLADCGDIPRDLPHYVEIDWEATARNIRVDYTFTEIDGVTYWYR